MRKLGLGPEECITIEDTQPGLTAAHSAGLRCLVVPSEMSNTRTFATPQRCALKWQKRSNSFVSSTIRIVMLRRVEQIVGKSVYSSDMRFSKILYLASILLAATPSCNDSHERSSHNADADHGSMDASVDHPSHAGDTNSPDLGTDLANVCPGANPAQECRLNAAQCLPSGCFCFNGLWACTADCAGGAACSKADAGADAAEHGGH